MNNKYDIFILIVSIFVTLIIVTGSIFLFKIIENKNRHTSKVLLTLSQREDEQKNIEILKEKFKELDTIEKRINNYFVDPDKIDIFVDNMEKLGINNNTELVVENVEVLNKKKDVISVKISIKGDFTDVVKVIYLLENLDYNIDLTEAYVNKENITKTINNEGMTEEIKNSFWVADVSFNILSLLKTRN